MDARIEGVIAAVPALRAAEATVAILAGGITNETFRVDVGPDSYVVRIGGSNAGALGIDRRREARAMKVVEGLGIGAEIVHVDPVADVLVTRFIRGRALDAAALAEPGMLELVARTIARVHAGPPFEGLFCPFETIRAYHQLAQARGAEMPAYTARALALAGELESELRAPEDARRPCHDDLLPANLILADTLRIIDWEYAAMGDPFFDLGNLAANLELDRPGIERLLAGYTGGEPDARGARAVEGMMVVSDLREGFWGIAQRGASTLDFDFGAYAERHLERALARREAR